MFSDLLLWAGDVQTLKVVYVSSDFSLKAAGRHGTKKITEVNHED
jgi:hypothetical protein